MAVKVRDSGKSAKRFAERAQRAVTEYVEGAQGAAQDWAVNAAGAQDNYDAGVNEAVAKKSFSKGVRKAGPGAFSEGVKNKGETRYPQGVAVADVAWQAGTQPFLDTVAALNLPPRKRRGDPGNYARVQAVGVALHAKKQALKQ